MAFNKVEYIWMNGKMIRWDDAKIHVLSHVVHYGSSIFEGQRCYKTAKGPACFRLMEHIDRLWDSCKIYRMVIPFTKQKVFDAILELVAINHLEECYIRPVVYRGYDSLGVDPGKCPIEIAMPLSRNRLIGMPSRSNYFTLHLILPCQQNHALSKI